MSSRAYRLIGATAIVGALVMTGSTVHADKGSLNDPAGDLPDIRKLAYNNADKKVTLSMTFADLADAQNQSYYIQWGKPKKYQVFHSPSAAITELRFYTDATSWTKVGCKKLSVVDRPAKDTTTVDIPRACIKKAPDTLRFKGIATMGLNLLDETKQSPKVKRG